MSSEAGKAKRSTGSALAAEAAAPTQACKSCGAAFQGRFCPQCGEQVYHEHDKSMAHFAEEAIHFATHLDGRFPTTLALLFKRPGQVARDYAEGRRLRHVKPLTLFMLTVLLCLLFPVFKGMNVPFADHLAVAPAASPLHRWADAKAAAEGIAVPALAAKFDAASPRIAKVALLVLLPLTAGWLVVLFARRRRMFFDHLVIATEINTVFLLLSFVVLPALSIAVLAAWAMIVRPAPLSVDIGDGSPLTLAMAAVFMLLSGLALRRFYDTSIGSTAFRTVLFLAGYAIIFFVLYRIVTFAVVMLFI